AASIVASRALAPLEGTIEGWRSFVQARSAYARVKALLLNSPLNLERLRLPRPAGYLNVERILYVPPPNKKVILNGISFQLKPGESLAIVGMDGSPLSGGQRQRIGLARAFYGNPRLIVLDEPNSNLDANGERALAKALLRAKEKQITVVTITQRAALLMSVDKIMILHQ